MKFIRQIIRESIQIVENIQLADKIYFKSGKLSPRVREVILQITGGDALTKIFADIYYAEQQQQHKMGAWAVAHVSDDIEEQPDETGHYVSDNDVMRREDWIRIKAMYLQLKAYNRNIFPIAGLNVNGVPDIWELIRALKERASILELFKQMPSIAVRNMKNDIRQERNSQELQQYRNDLEYFLGQYSLLSNRKGRMKSIIDQKMFKSNITLEDLIKFADEKENLIGGKKLNKTTIKKIINEYHYELEIVYENGDIMVVDVTGEEGIKALGCNSVWCFTYGSGVYRNRGDWHNNSTNDHVYVIIDFSQSSDSPDFMYVLVKPINFKEVNDGSGNQGNDTILADMANQYREDPLNIISHFMSLDDAYRIFTFGEYREGPTSKWPYEDPNQLKLDLKENKVIKNEFSSLDLDDIKFNSTMSPGHMSLEVKFVNPKLDKYFSNLMKKDFRLDRTTIDIETKNMNHIHIDSIPLELRNIGLGKLLYRKVLQEFGFISTGFVHARISEDAQRVWESLIKSGEYYYFKSTDNIRVTLAEKYGHPAIYEHILDYYGDNLEETNYDASEVGELDEDLNKFRMMIRKSFLNEAKKSKFEKLKDNKIPLTDEERKKVMDADAVWHFSPGNKPSPAVWKSKDKNGKITYVTNTHRAYQERPTLKGAISIFHSFIKGTS